MSDGFNCEFADICDFVCVAPDGCFSFTGCPYYEEVKE